MDYPEQFCTVRKHFIKPFQCQKFMLKAFVTDKVCDRHSISTRVRSITGLYSFFSRTLADLSNAQHFAKVYESFFYSSLNSSFAARSTKAFIDVRLCCRFTAFMNYLTDGFAFSHGIYAQTVSGHCLGLGRHLDPTYRQVARDPAFAQTVWAPLYKVTPRH
ncbi:hypothetical protein AVEN_267871-1 [Araneus ventricosus]|uniref:Uncharacterized protein n=1 Tax=Araneus ventricosus TaxID=182803 RepID=A0A4Y2V073_ARAVE|nr:hypothetical protein AVEN_267871-1 [Araneus ventricosus]